MRQSVSIQWFPGHMAKARRQVEEKLKMVDIVFELLDARLPFSSQNPMIHQVVKEKPRLVLLTKCDLADAGANETWIKAFQEQDHHALLIDAKTGKGIQQIVKKSEQLLEPLFAKRMKKGIRSRRVRAMIIGIPNVGKSSLINRLAKRAATQTGDRPGVTKMQQWIRIGKTMELLDTPGILWPKFDNKLVGFRLAASGAIKEELLPIEEVALYAIEYLQTYHPRILQERFSIDKKQEPIAALEIIGKKRGCLQRGGTIDLHKTSELFLQDFRGGRMGRLTLELPDDEVILNEDNYGD